MSDAARGLVRRRPAIVVNGARVRRFATVRPPVGFVGRTRVYVDGIELGPVPHLLVTQPLHPSDAWPVERARTVSTPAGLKTSRHRAQRRANDRRL